MTRKTSGFTSTLLLVLGVAAEAATVTGRVEVAGRAPRAGVVTIVYAESLDGARVQPGTFTVSQRNKTFSPRVLPVPVGSTVRFPNDDLIFHNVFSLSRPNPFDFGLYRAGSVQTRSFQAPATYRVFCNIHPQMTAVVLVLPTSHFTEVGAAGTYRLELPVGRYRITAWSERSQPMNAVVTVADGSQTIADLVLDESRFVAVAHPNKFGMQYATIAYDPLRDRKPR